MKAARIHPPHEFHLDDLDSPPPGPGEVKVRIRAGGICGSDLHYFHHGGFGDVRIREPMTLGHEVAGEVAELGAGVQGLAAGDKVAVNPSMPCGKCRFCLSGQANNCSDMRFFGSAMRFPHLQGLFRQELVCPAEQLVKVAPSASLQMVAFAEPTSVCLHAAAQAGELLGKRVLVTGVGPIGALCVMIARHAGAREVVASDIAGAPLAAARKVGADRVLNTAEDPHALDEYGVDKGYFDVAFEASGVASAVAAVLTVVRPRGTFVQLGLGNAPISLSMNSVVTKEINLRGTFRFNDEFPIAVEMLASGAIDPSPLLTAALPLEEAPRAFELATDRSKAMKVQLIL